MRINEDLEKTLLELEQNNNGNVLSLLDVASALEGAYNQINNSCLKNEKGFTLNTDDYICEKETYDAMNGKTIYCVSKPSDGTKLFKIEVSNIGEINFSIIDEESAETQLLIEKLNEASEGLLEKLKFNAEISYFTENRELVLSKRPYIAIKMGNFVEGDKAVLVYRNEGKTNEVNKQNSNVQLIRLDQITGYLKNIKLVERQVPILAYAFFDKANEKKIATNEFYIMEETYPYLTEEKVEKLKSDNYLSDCSFAATMVSILGAILLGATGGIVGAITSLPTLPLLLGGLGLPIATGTTVFLRAKTNVKRAFQKEELLEMANQKLYIVLKNIANEKATAIEKEMTFKRKKNLNLSKVKPEDITPREIIAQLKKNLKELSGSKANLYLAVIQQLENAYNLNNSLIASDESLNNQALYGELLYISNEIFDLAEFSLSEVLENVLATMERLLYYGDSNQTIINLNQISKAINNYSINMNSELRNKYENLYLEAMLISKDKNNGLSVQTISTIPSKHRLVNVIGKFAERILPLGTKESSADTLQYLANLTTNTAEVKLVRMIDEIYDQNLVYDLLGKNLQQEKVKVKTPESNPKK